MEENNKLSVPNNVSVTDSLIPGFDKADFAYFVVASLINLAISFVVYLISKTSFFAFVAFGLIETVLFFLFKKIEGMAPFRYLQCFIKGITEQQKYVFINIRDGEIIGINEEQES